MGIFGSLKRFNCFGSAKGQKSRRNITKELSNMQETVSILQAQIQTKRRVLELCKERQRVEEAKQEIMKNTRSYLLAQAEQIESRLKRALLKSQQSMSDMIKTLDMERKAIVFWNNLNNSAKDLGKVADT